MGQCSARVSTRSPVSANWPLAEMLVLYQGPGGWWSLQGRAKGCQSETASKGDRWPGGSWENQGLKRLRDAHQDSADNQFCGPTAQTGTPIQGQILVEGSSKHGQAFRSSILLVSIGHPALAGGCLEAVWAGGSLPTTPPGNSCWLWKGCNAQPVFGAPLARGKLRAGQGDGTIQMWV